ncbi:hypothetical protein JHD47_04155 [Sulfurimonas sp. SAG-AH-194-L11]|nr:hypothetical protein [Sulfurimonas sp. SAG-AH-194-L11]MDF1877005.1 hypothetical protein [Sulfurimonas sp. SAG-AH-194-L11]
MKKNLLRSDDIYKEVEEFKDYELTQCIAYEMAIRNKDNLEEIDTIAEYYKDNKEAINEEYLKNAIEKTKEYLKVCWLISKSELIPFISLDSMFYDESTNEEYFIENLSVFEDTRIDKIIYQLISDMTGYEDGNKKRGLSSEEPRVIEDDLLDTNSLEKRTFRNGYTIETIVSERIEHAIIPLSENEECDDNKGLSSANDWKIYYENGGESIHSSYKILDNFKRPKLKCNQSIERKYPSLEIDLTKPLKEILAYITHIKNDIDNNDILKAPLEILGEELKKADNLICDSKGKCFDSRTFLTKQQKLADMFYIYDGLQAGMTQRKIQSIVYNYYEDERNDINQTLDINTLIKYNKIAKEYIDKKRYRELITGVKEES